MQELEKILQEIEKAKNEYPCACFPWYLTGLSEAEKIIRKHMNDGWIPVEERLPEERINPITNDFYEYQVTAKFGFDTDVRSYKFGNGHWWHGPANVDKYVIAWRPLPESYRERSEGE